ncbi:hypothetical protein [Teredinibacter turnerae]|uniref:hypothetical protein n=1 Tax=Teredinibacter turnerae TaxID=2426 RepID=UPI0012BC1715|nr:hypothetical protein [Teredinibacter turnerae]
MNRLFIFISVFFLNACGVYECIDAKFEREPRPIDKVFNVDVTIDDAVFSKEVRCEHYYDAMCAERGNWWSIREVGKESKYQSSNVEYDHPKYGLIEFPVPDCLDMVEAREISLNHLLPKIAGKTHWLMDSKGNARVYKTHRNNPDSEAVKVELTVKINGREIHEK